MYVPHEFSFEQFDEIRKFIQQHPFGTLITTGEDQLPVATHLPFYLVPGNDTNIHLEAHLALANKQSKLIRNGRNALVIFQGPDAYISSAVYDHPNVPTWNYQSVHLYGTLTLMNDDQLAEHLHKMVEHHEQKRNTPLDYRSLPEDLLHKYRKEIIGFRIESFSIEGARKLSQNRNAKDFERILDELSNDPANQAIIDLMKRSRKK